MIMKMIMFSIKDFFSKYDQIRRKLRFLFILYSEMNKNKNHSLNTQNSKLKFNNFEHVQYFDLSCFFIEFEDCWVVLSRHLLDQSKKWKHRHVWNLFKVTNKNKTLFSYLYSELWKGFTRCSGVFIKPFEATQRSMKIKI